MIHRSYSQNPVAATYSADHGFYRRLKLFFRVLNDYPVFTGDRVIADDVIEPREMLEIKAWLEAHKVLPSDFAQTFHIISDLLKRGKIGRVGDDDMKDLYSGLLDCLNELRRRPTM